ncbi:hypothetical protein HHL26_23630 [Sphingobium sp. TB-6]|uniref:hypothetical protein n=1 Tax=Sphingobium sp. TB-6 TaxID=2728850 RepID=UPI00146D34AF|nr:hypothetical protein [Sphingobium sp. TB-6]NML91993.1 hypothetical protein [Sphingobium sp. TB-6]
MARPKDINRLNPQSPKFDAGLATDVYAMIAKELGEDEVNFEEVKEYIETQGGSEVGF